MFVIRREALPEGWRHPSYVGHCQIHGELWYDERPDQVLLVVPSAIVAAEINFVIRGLAPQARVKSIEELEFDPRLWDMKREEGRLEALKISEPGAPG